MSACIFCNIVTGETPASVVLEDEHSVAFLDHRPLFPGHCLLVPRLHLETLIDVSQPLLSHLSENARKLAIAMEQALDAEGAFVAINNRVSQSVPHVHVHVVPRRKGDGLKGFFWPRNKYRNGQHMEEVREALAKAFKDLKRL